METMTRCVDCNHKQSDHDHDGPCFHSKGGLPCSCMSFMRARREDAAGERVDEMPEWVTDSYWTLRQMLDGPPEQHSPHAWAEFASLLVRGYEDVVKDFEKVNAERIAALSTAERERDELRDAMDAIYVERYGITYRELEERVRAVQNGEYVTHEEAMQRIRASLPARVPSGGEEGR